MIGIWRAKLPPGRSFRGTIGAVEIGLSNAAGSGLRLVRELSANEAEGGHVHVERENRSAAGLTPVDARALLGEATAAALDGGRAAILSPERRRRLVAMGERLGVRAFDANLVIAVVQDRVRRGESWRDWLGGAGTATEIISASDHSMRDKVMSRLLLIAVLASTLSGAMVAWTLGLLGH